MSFEHQDKVKQIKRLLKPYIDHNLQLQFSHENASVSGSIKERMHDKEYSIFIKNSFLR